LAAGIKGETRQKVIRSLKSKIIQEKQEEQKKEERMRANWLKEVMTMVLSGMEAAGRSIIIGVTRRGKMSHVMRSGTLWRATKVSCGKKEVIKDTGRRRVIMING